MFRNLKRKLLTYLKLDTEIRRLQDELDALRSTLYVSHELYDEYQQTRKQAEYLRCYENPAPLVSVCIATYNRADVLVERSLKSVLEQSYKNLEIIVVGDCCTDHTARRMAEIKDPRLKFVNLPERGNYPSDPKLRWMVAGAVPTNHALHMATGDFITHLDDDDRYAENRIGNLVEFIQKTRADFVWHPFWYEKAKDDWRLNTADELVLGRVTTSSILYHRWFTKIDCDLKVFRFREPGDFHRIRKFKYLHMNAVRYPEPLLWHYVEHNQT